MIRQIGSLCSHDTYFLDPRLALGGFRASGATGDLGIAEPVGVSRAAEDLGFAGFECSIRV